MASHTDPLPLLHHSDGQPH
ncbi:hypothetical protein LINPERPRIM_LOCUS32359 [Linum perenne]